MSKKKREERVIRDEEDLVRLALFLKGLWDWNFFEAKPGTASAWSAGKKANGLPRFSPPKTCARNLE